MLSAINIIRDRDTRAAMGARLLHAVGLFGRRIRHANNAEKVHGVETEIVWLNEKGEPFDASPQAMQPPEPVTPDEWFAQIVLPFFREPVYRQKTGKIAAFPVLAQSMVTTMRHDDPRTETISRIVRTNLHYIFDLTMAGFTRRDIGNILTAFKAAEAEAMTRFVNGDLTVFYQRIDAGYIPTVQARGADIWTMSYAIVQERYRRESAQDFAWVPVPGKLTVTRMNETPVVFPRAGGGVWMLDRGGTFAIHEDKLPAFAAAVLRVLDGEKVADVFFQPDPEREGRLRLKAEYDLYAQKPGFALRAFAKVAMPDAQRPVFERIQKRLAEHGRD
jgi:hypothetical protein